VHSHKHTTTQTGKHAHTHSLARVLSQVISTAFSHTLAHSTLLLSLSSSLSRALSLACSPRWRAPVLASLLPRSLAPWPAPLLSRLPPRSLTPSVFLSRVFLIPPRARARALPPPLFLLLNSHSVCPSPSHMSTFEYMMHLYDMHGLSCNRTGLTCTFACTHAHTYAHIHTHTHTHTHTRALRIAWPWCLGSGAPLE